MSGVARYMLAGGQLHLPPENGVDSKGQAVSGFGARIAADAAYAAANGYYPAQALPAVPEDGGCYAYCYVLQDGVWQGIPVPQ